MRYIITVCPICKTALGKRPFDQTVEIGCEECDLIFTFEGGNDTPIKNRKRINREPEKKCGCHGCGR